LAHRMHKQTLYRFAPADIWHINPKRKRGIERPEAEVRHLASDVPRLRFGLVSSNLKWPFS